MTPTAEVFSSREYRPLAVPTQTRSGWMDYVGENVYFPDLSRHFRNTLARLASFAELAENWDREGAAPIDPRAIDVARNVALRLYRIGFSPTAAPLQNGGVLLELSLHDRDLLIDVLRSGVAEWTWVKDGQVLDERLEVPAMEVRLHT